MSDKPLSVDEIMGMVAEYGDLRRDQMPTDAGAAEDEIRAELEKLAKAAGDPS
jgi:hypothetical protein